jgi:hypothetical protein
MNNQYVGMTVNERLYVSGMLEKFDKAVDKKDVSEVISILEKVELTETSIHPILIWLGLIDK